MCSDGSSIARTLPPSRKGVKYIFRYHIPLYLYASNGLMTRKPFWLQNGLKNETSRGLILLAVFVGQSSNVFCRKSWRRMKCASDTLADSRVQKPKNFLAFFSRLLPPPLRREAEKEMERNFLVLLRRHQLHYIIPLWYTILTRYTVDNARRINKARSEPEKDQNQERYIARRYSKRTRR